MLKASPKNNLRNKLCRRFPLGGCHCFWCLIKSTPGWSRRRRTWHILKQIEPVFSNVESLVHRFELETKRQSMQWKQISFSPPKKAKVVPSAGNVITSVFWDAKSIVFIDCLQKGQTINWEYYANLLRQLRKVIKSKWPAKLTKWVLFHQHDQGNAPVHKTVVAMAAVLDWGFELVDDPPYYPDLARSDHFLFPNMKIIWLGSSIGPMVRSYLQLSVFSRIRMRASIPRKSKRWWKKCVHRRGEKITHIRSNSTIASAHTRIYRLTSNYLAAKLDFSLQMETIRP